MIWTWFIYAAAINFSPVHLLSKPLSRNKRSDEFVPCDEGWFLFREKCLKVEGVSWKRGETLQWENAENRCKEYGGNLVSIQSKEEQDFIIHFLLPDTRVTTWMGLRKRSNSQEFAWSDGSVFNYTYWYEGQPTNGDNEECGAMMFDPAIGKTGEWDDMRCDRWRAYICQKGINVGKRSQNPQLCTVEEGGGWKFQNTCYHIVMERKTWDSAEQHCRDKYGGHLATILHLGIDIFLDYIGLYPLDWAQNGYLQPSTTNQLWLGIKIRDRSLQKWTSGWFVAYNRTTRNSSEMVVDDTCVLRRNRKEWNMDSCSNKYPFICDTFKGPPVLKPAENESHCPENPSDWIDLGGDYCYFFETQNALTWYEAGYECKRRGGRLASIHSKEESELIQPFVKYIYTDERGIHIGFLRQVGREDIFVWADGTPMDYVQWSPWEPNSDAEKCGEIWPTIMDWNDVPCGAPRGYICSVRKVKNVTETETIECTSPIRYDLLIGVSVSMYLVLILLGVVVCYFRSRGGKRRKASTGTVISENAFETYRLQKISQRIQVNANSDDHHYDYPRFEDPHYETVD